MIRRVFVFTFLFSISITVAQIPGSKKSAFGNVDDISKSQLFDYLSFIASDELEGRDTPSRGLDSAAAFIAEHLSRWGYTPMGGDGTFFQKIILIRNRIRPKESFIEISGKKYWFGPDYVSKSIPGKISASMIYVNTGYAVRAKGIDPYKGINVKGKVMIALAAYPEGVSRRDLRGKIGVDYDTPANYAKTHGALAVILIPSDRALNEWEKTIHTEVEKGTLSVPGLKKADEKESVPYITASFQLIEAIFSGERTLSVSLSDRDSAMTVPSFSLSPKRNISINIEADVETLFTQNIVAVLEGSDQKRKKEYVAFGAHYDHLGIRSEPVNGDSIYNGADDDGSGTTGLIAMAEAFAKGERPKRSLLFVWHCGEEKGLWGSKYFVAHPTVPLSSIVTQLNIDMIGRSRPDTGVGSDNQEVTASDEIYSIGSFMMSSELGKLNERVNASLYNMHLNYTYDNPDDPKRLFYRSDHYNYAKNGIPIVFYFDGIHEDYHQVSDEVSKIDFEKLMKATKTIFALGWEIANLPFRLVVDKEFDRDVID